MGSRKIFLSWLLLLMSTVLIGSAAFSLLKDSQEYQVQQEKINATDRANLVAAQINLAAETLEDSIMTSLQEIDEETLEEDLYLWKDENPLIRNTFIYSPKEKLISPQINNTSDSELRGFMMRYAPLFSGRFNWGDDNNISGPGLNDLVDQDIVNNFQNTDNNENPDTQEFANNNNSPLQQKNSFSSNYGSKIKELNKRGQFNKKQEVLQIEQAQAPFQIYKSGWIPWFSENKLYLLAWVQKEKGGNIYGVELEMIAFLSQLITPFPELNSSTNNYQEAFILTDGHGKILHKEGELDISDRLEANAKVPVGNALPHWNITYYYDKPSVAASFENSFYLFGSLLIGTFLLAILFGGSLLFWHAHKNAQELVQKTSFVSNVSHELKTPLTNIRMYAELLSEKRISDETKRTKYIGIIVSESQRLSRLVNNILDFSRLEQRKKKYHLEELMLQDSIQNILEAQNLRLQEAGMELSCQFNSNDKVKIDRDALEQVLVNLIDNAVKYASSGKELAIKLENQGRHAILSVMDRGPGIPGDHAKKIFTKFHQVDDALTANKSGVGLGLCISKILIEDLNGKLTYEQREGGGACFSLILPKVETN